ncbi:kinase-like protein [Venturia nashicola]|uniref:Kinase-like protein n=1 Tax=Venturia nashicola TaxID=86259 RepID=A0A4Z1NZH6_9PEZI|nr:kinase-like protein [Venturia nashicola]TLD32042.1 kinase-like protein [Venturia nashicola]
MECMRDNFQEGALLDGRFRTLAPLNHGSFGMVFKALDTWTNKEVALKCSAKPSVTPAHDQWLSVDDKSEELVVHRRIGDHPNIINLLHNFEDDYHTYLVLEFCANGDLYEAIRFERGPGQTEHVRECMLQLVDAVEHMHAKGVYHRDIKPENILLDRDGSLKLGDFGLATTDCWSYEAAVGSDRYMSPEQYDPGNHGYSPASADVWAIGICLLNILFSRNPFATPCLSDPLFLDFYNDRQSLFDVFPNMSQDTYEVLVHCLAIDPSKRSLLAVRAALDRAVCFTTDQETLDEFCAVERENVMATANRSPLRTPSISTPHQDLDGGFQWQRALAMSPPVRQLSVIPDTEHELMFPSSENSHQDWFSKRGTASVASFVDSGLGMSLKSTNMELKSDSFRFNRSKPMPISGSLPATMARPIPSMASVFGKKREFASKSWSDLWDEEEEEENAMRMSVENDKAMSNRGRVMDLKEESESEGRITPRQGLTEMKNPAIVNNSRNRTPDAVCDPHVSEHTGFMFEEDEDHTPATPVTPRNSRYSPPPKRSAVDKWAALGERRKGYPTPSKTPQDSSAPPRKRSRATSWRARTIDWSNKQQQLSLIGNELGVLEHHQRLHSPLGKSKEASKVGPWTSSKDWRRHGSPQQEDVGDIEWVWRHDLHL